MRKRDLMLIVGFMACFTLALAALILSNIETQRRSETNIGLLCAKLEAIDGKPCQLLQPSEEETRLFAFIRRR